jgi:hypothetical protein
MEENDRVLCGPIGGRLCLEPLNKLQQTGSVKDYWERFLQLIVKVGNNVTEKNKLQRYVEGFKDEVCTVIRVGMVDGRYTIFAQVKTRGRSAGL